MVDEVQKGIASDRRDQLTMPIKIGQRVAVAALLNILLLWFAYSFSFGGAQTIQPGLEWAIVLISVVAFIGIGVVVIPQIFRHYIRFEDSYLEVAIGFHKALIRYSDILTVSDRATPIVRQWYAIAPGGIQIHATVFDEVIAVANEELLFEELLKRNPEIVIKRSRISA